MSPMSIKQENLITQISQTSDKKAKVDQYRKELIKDLDDTIDDLEKTIEHWNKSLRHKPHTI